MIKIQRPPSTPQVLSEDGKIETEKNISEFNNAKLNKLPSPTDSFKREIYAHKSVKDALIQCQYGKCCFCESSIQHISSGDVEHFRPKGGCRQEPDQPIHKDSYFWLAYEWNNLLFCCEQCNRQFKRNLFPLLEPNERALSHEDNIFNERPVFINPADENPEDLIGFRADTPYAIDDNSRAAQTIENIGLRRTQLRDRRYEYLKHLKQIFILANSDIPESEEAKQLLLRASSANGEYTAMVRCAIRDEFRYI